MRNIIRSKQWYALYTKSRHESCVNNLLAKKSVESFFPQMHVLSRRKDRRKMIDVPMFPGYLFVKTVLNSPEHLSILKSPGAVILIGNTHGAIPIPEESIASLMILTNKDALEIGPCYHEGDLVMIMNGPFVGVTGIFCRQKGGGKVMVNIDALGQSVAVELEMADIQLVQEYRKVG